MHKNFSIIPPVNDIKNIEQDTPLISVVIPVYNVEKYLDQCVKTVLCQTYRNYEVILVDDGSTDKSGVMCDWYGENYKNVKVFHKPNGGLSDARNFGVKRAKGDLVSFVDSDDYVTEDYLSYLYDLKVRFSADISCADCIRVYPGKEYTLNLNKDEKVCDPCEAIQRICYGSPGAWSRLYPRDILLNYPFPVGRLYEDCATTYKLMDACKKIVFSTKNIYMYVRREGGITRSPISERQFDIIWANDEMLSFVRMKYPTAEKAARYRYANCVCIITDILFDYNGESKEQRAYFTRIRTALKPQIRSLLTNKRASITIKIKCVAIMLGYYPAKLLWKLKRCLIKRIRGV